MTLKIIQITVRAVLAAMQITEVDEYRREVSEARNMKETQLSNLSPVGQKSTLIKYIKFLKSNNETIRPSLKFSLIS